MTLEELLNEEKESILSEAGRISTLNKRRKKKEGNGKRKVGPDNAFELSKEAKSKLRKHKDINWKDGDPNWLPGRERLVSAVCNMSGASPSAVRSYITKKFEQWFTHDPEADWIADLEKKARAMDHQKFNPRDYRKSLSTPMPRGASAGKEPGEHKGRAYFFVGLMNGFANHFKGKSSKKQNSKNKK